MTDWSNFDTLFLLALLIAFAVGSSDIESVELEPAPFVVDNVSE